MPERKPKQTGSQSDTPIVDRVAESQRVAAEIAEQLMGLTELAVPRSVIDARQWRGLRLRELARRVQVDLRLMDADRHRLDDAIESYRTALQSYRTGLQDTRRPPVPTVFNPSFDRYRQAIFATSGLIASGFQFNCPGCGMVSVSETYEGCLVDARGHWRLHRETEGQRLRICEWCFQTYAEATGRSWDSRRREVVSEAIPSPQTHQCRSLLEHIEWIVHAGPDAANLGRLQDLRRTFLMRIEAVEEQRMTGRLAHDDLRMVQSAMETLARAFATAIDQMQAALNSREPVVSYACPGCRMSGTKDDIAMHMDTHGRWTPEGWTCAAFHNKNDAGGRKFRLEEE